MTDTAAARLVAASLGTDAGKSAASWAFDGNTDTNVYRKVLTGLEDGDPAILDAYGPASGWLSGEWADAPTPQTLAGDLSLDETNDPDGEILAELATAYEEAADAAYWAEIERTCRAHVEEA